MAGLPNLRKQQGISLSGLILVLIIVAMFAVIGMKVVPAVVEYQSIKKAIVLARDSGSSASEIVNSFNKQASAGYITTISGKDLEITKDANGVVVSFAYEKKLPLVGPASLLLEFAGTTAK